MVTTTIQYLAQGEGYPVYSASSAGRNASFSVDRGLQRQQVEVLDARSNLAPASSNARMHAAGFDLLEHNSRVDNFLDSGQIEQVYEAELVDLLKRFTGASRVHLFDHTARASDPDLREQKQLREPSTLVHNDYTAKSGFVCLQENLGTEAQALAQGRFHIVNVWRPLNGPVQNFPLALCDARSIARADLVPAERRAKNHIGEIMLANHSDAHQWFYFPQMQNHEVLVFKTFDSIDGGLNPCSIHCAIDLPDAPADAPPRESIESRAFLFYD